MAYLPLEDNILDFICKDHIKIGDKLSFKAVDNSCNDFNIDDIKSDYKYKVISVLPSIDTSVCLAQTKNFNEKIIEMKDTKLITISRDLPFATTRACEGFINKDHLLLSDAFYRDFGKVTGLAIEEIQLLARAVLVLDAENTVKYMQIVSPLITEPNYDEVLSFLKG